MRKEATHNLRLVPKLLTALFVMTAFMSFPAKTLAGVCDEDPKWYQFGIQFNCKLKEINPLVSIQRTVNDAASNLATGFVTSTFFNSDPDDFGTCGVANLADSLIAAGIDPVSSPPTGLAYTSTDYSDAMAQAPTLGCDFNATTFGTRANGSFIGITKMAYESAFNEKPPVSLAYYVKHNLRKVPIVNQTAYAQDPGPYSGWGLLFVLTIWEKMRNIAYAMISVIMLIVGILIITRKKINPQTVVTVQTALPRVIISLLLITFSYPIGAIFISSVIPFTIIAISVVAGALAEDTEYLANMNYLNAAITVIIGNLGPQGFVGIIVGILLAALTIIVLLISVIKVLIINVKMFISVIFAPIQFAIAAIPGQEKLIQDWFKGMLAKSLSIAAIWFLVALAWYFIALPFVNLEVMSRYSSVFVGLEGIGRWLEGDFIYGFMLLPIMAIIIMFFAISADKKIETFIMGDKRR